MPTRSNSVASSIYSIIRKGSASGRYERVHERQATEAETLSHILPLANNAHCHMIPPVPASIRPDDSILEWIAQVQEARPEVVIASTPKYFTVPESKIAEIAPGTIQFNPTALLLLRILNTKLYSTNERSQGYQMQIRIGHEASASSCASTKSGDLIDLFLVDLNQGIDPDNCFIEIAVVSQAQDHMKHSTLRKLLGLKQSSANLRASTASMASVRGEPGHVVATLKIPLAAVAFNSAAAGAGQNLDDQFPRPSGTFYLCEPGTSGANHPTQSGTYLISQNLNAGRIVGEITLDVIESPDTFNLTLGNNAPNRASESKFSAPLTVLRSEGRVAHWQRVSASIHSRDLVAYDFQRFVGSSPLWTRSLKQVVSLDFIRHHAMSIENVIEIAFAGGEKLFAYADDEKLGLKWADKLSLTIWGQPYSTQDEE